MHINLSPEIEQFLQSKVETGFYSNTSEVIRDAIRRMRDEDEKIAAVRAAVQRGDEQLDKGQAVPYTQDLIQRAAAKARTNAQRGKKVNRDVTP
ncbi:MAG TPA: type II toxin-antitoxin system ParD family antitoxin [Burkholderiales bacterium]|nr:type II toxin-antitoxin system ParD family antitoxin [Burkholderiales bacterium]